MVLSIPELESIKHKNWMLLMYETCERCTTIQSLLNSGFCFLHFIVAGKARNDMVAAEPCVS